MSAPGRTDWRLILTLWAAGLGAAGQFAKVSVIFPSIQASYPEAGASAGFLVSALSLVGVALGVAAGLIAARIGARRLLVGGLLLGAALSAVEASFPHLPWMLGLRALEGLSHLSVVVSAPVLIAAASAPRDRPATMTLWSSFFGVAFALTAWLGGPLAAAFGPGSLFLAHAAYMAAMAAALARLLPDSRPSSAPPLRLAPMLASHAAIYRSPRLAAPALGWLFYTLTFVALVTVLPGEVAPEWRGFVLSAMPLASTASALILGVALLRRIPADRVVILGFGLSLLAALTLIALPGAPWLTVGLAVALGLVQAASFAAIPQLNEGPEAQALANGAVAQMGNLGNTLGTPLLLWAAEAQGQVGALAVAAAAYALGFGVHLHQMRRRRISR